jgi:hypothetical protein
MYYREYCKLYYANIILTGRVFFFVTCQLQNILNEKEELKIKLNRIEVNYFSDLQDQ